MTRASRRRGRGPAAARPARAPPRRTAGRSAAPAPAAAWSVRSRLRDADLAVGASNVSIVGGGERAPPERVQAAAIQLVAVSLRVGLAGAGLFPQAGRLVRLHAAAADASRPAGRSRRARCRGSSRRAGGARAAGEQRVVRVARRAARPAPATTAGTWRDGTISRCSALTSQPRSMNVARQPVEQLGMGRQPPLAAEVLRRRDQAAAEEHLPDAVHGDARGQRVAAIGQPAGQAEAVARRIGRERQEARAACRAATSSVGAS